jgi:hypothetical protein
MRIQLRSSGSWASQASSALIEATKHDFPHSEKLCAANACSGNDNGKLPFGQGKLGRRKILYREVLPSNSLRILIALPAKKHLQPGALGQRAIKVSSEAFDGLCSERIFVVIVHETAAASFM